MRTLLCFRPEYVGRFKCDGSKCDAFCCRQGWQIRFDKPTYKKYSRLRPDGDKIIAALKYDAKAGCYVLKEHPCTFLTADNLCCLQRDHGEQFLSSTCATYPRYTLDFGAFFEQTLTLSCPVVAEAVLFEREPMKFEFVSFAEGDRIGLVPVAGDASSAERRLEAQIAMISILQERTFTLDQRLIVLSFFVDKLEEISAVRLNEVAFRKLIAAYESKEFLAAQVPTMLQTVRFEPRRFIGLMLKVFNSVFGGFDMGEGRKFLDAVVDVLDLKLDDNNRVSVGKVAVKYVSLAAERKIFLDKYSHVLENYFVNDLLLNHYPWRYDGRILRNFGPFLLSSKVLELIMFASTLKGYGGRDELIRLAGWFASQTVHNSHLHERLSKHVDSDLFALLDSNS